MMAFTPLLARAEDVDAAAAAGAKASAVSTTMRKQQAVARLWHLDDPAAAAGDSATASESRGDLQDNKALAAACEAEVRQFCQDVPLGDDRVRRCMQDHKYDRHMGKGCQQEVVFDEISRAASYDAMRMDRCVATAVDLCGAAFSDDVVDALLVASQNEQQQQQQEQQRQQPPQGRKQRQQQQELATLELAMKGAVVRCLVGNLGLLSEAAAAVSEPDCIDEVRRAVSEEADDIRFAPDSNLACEDDILQFCSSVSPGAQAERCARATERTTATAILTDGGALHLCTMPRSPLAS
jgi:hypothetical protein